MLHPRKAIRALGIAESFRPTESKSTLAGVVMRTDLVVDGFVFGASTVGGEDATSSLLKMFRRLKRLDVNLIILSGCIISRYNIVDIDELARRSRLPVIGLTYEESKGILEAAIKRRFESPKARLEAYRRLGAPDSLRLASGKKVFARTAGLSLNEAKTVLDAFTLQGAVPEPVRLARLLARSVRLRP